MIAVANKKIEGVKADNANLKDSNKNLEDKNQYLQAQLDGVILPENMDAQVTEKLEQLSSSNLSFKSK